MKNVSITLLLMSSNSKVITSSMTTGLLGRCGLRSWCQTNLSKGIDEI